MNHVELTALLEARDVLRHTPAGIAILRMHLQHQSQVQEAGVVRWVSMRLAAVALGHVAEVLADWPSGQRMSLRGFLAPERQGTDRLVLHVQAVAAASD